MGSLRTAVPFVRFVDVSRAMLRAALPPAGTAVRARLARLRGRLWLPALMVFVWGTYAFFLTAGGIFPPPNYGGFYDLLADAFRQGTTSIPLPVSPELERAPNPYDPVNAQHWIHDLSYYKGKYYAYWGPAPALLQAVAKTLLGIHWTINDQYLALFHLCLCFAFGALLIERMARRLFPCVPRWLLALGMLVFAFANPTLHTAATSSTYHTAIVAAQAWLVGGLLAAFDAVWDAGTPRFRNARLVLAGVAWSLALGSRVTVAPAIAVFVAASIVAIARATPQRRWKSAGTTMLCLAAPLVAASAGLLAYNFVRFEKLFEFGTNLQTTVYPPFMARSVYFVSNLYTYLLRPFETSCQFPYVFQAWSMGPPAFPKGYEIPSGYMIFEPVVGWLYAVPIAWLSPFAFVLFPRSYATEPRRFRAYAWCFVSFGALASLAGVASMGLYMATTRYLCDVTNGIVLFSLLAGFGLRAHRFASYAPRVISAWFALLGTATITFGFFLGYHGYNGQFQRFHPALDEKLVRALSFCGDVPPTLPLYAL